MNTSDVERRLEELAAGGASPEVPEALWDQLARLEAGDAARRQPLRSLGSQAGGRRRIRSVTLLGLAAALTMAGGLALIGGSHLLRTPPSPSPQPTPPSLGPWTQVHTLDSVYNQYQTVFLSWQNDEIVGVAEGHDDFDLRQFCILQSKDGRAWTCGDLPNPTGISCNLELCYAVNGIAVRNGRWVVIGQIVPDVADPAAPPDAGRQLTTFTWTSNDGITWTEQAGARLLRPEIPLTVMALEMADVVATQSGFVMGGSAVSEPLFTGVSVDPGASALWITTDGTSWRPATFTPRSSVMLSAQVSDDSAGGILAAGTCLAADGKTSRPCTAHSTDGVTWTTSDPAPGVSAGLAGRLAGAGIRPEYRDGHWAVHLSTHFADLIYSNKFYEDSGYYLATSTDGLNWTLAREPWLEWLNSAPDGNGSGGGYYPGYSSLTAGGGWAIAGGAPVRLITADPSPHWTQPPDSARHLYWSADGITWQAAGSPPPGSPVGLVETPTQLIAIMALYPPGEATDTTVPAVSVWAAPKN